MLAGWLGAAGRYLEIFGRKNNLRDFWVTVGNEVTGQVGWCSECEAQSESLQALSSPHSLHSFFCSAVNQP